MDQIIDLIPEWKIMRATLQDQIKFFGPQGPGLHASMPVETLQNCIAELDYLIEYCSAQKR